MINVLSRKADGKHVGAVAKKDAVESDHPLTAKAAISADDAAGLFDTRSNFYFSFAILCFIIASYFSQVPLCFSTS